LLFQKTMTQFNPEAFSAVYTMKCIQALYVLLEDAKWDMYTERHLDLKLFGTILQPLDFFIYREVQSHVSKFVRQLGHSGTAKRPTGHLVDYLLLVSYLC
jgi:hypothetical protein